jgi:hypothetical protein
MTSILLTVISEARVNIEVEEAPKIIITKVIPKVLREVYVKITKVFLKEKVIPKTLSNITPRDAGSVIN